MADKKEEKKTTSVKELARYESAFIAGMLNQGDKEERQYAGMAMHDFYKQSGTDADDPIIQNAINSGGIRPAIEVYAEKYVKSIIAMKLGDYITYLTERGSVLGKAPDKLKKIIDKYKNSTIGEIAKSAKKDKDAEKILRAIQSSENIARAALKYKFIQKANSKSEQEGLEQLVKEEEEELAKAA